MGNVFGGNQLANGSARQPWRVQEPGAAEACRFDLREHSCFPYPPVENQGNEVTCVAHSFATALYCAKRIAAGGSTNLEYPGLEEIFADALRQSPDKQRGVSFEAIARGVERIYGSDMRSLTRSFKMLQNDAQIMRRILTDGMPIIAGYQVDKKIDDFHRDAKTCEEHGFMLPRFDSLSESITGHAVLILGYDFRVQAFIARNSWGRDWGVDGHFLIPFHSVEDPDAFTDLWALLPQ